MSEQKVRLHEDPPDSGLWAFDLQNQEGVLSFTVNEGMVDALYAALKGIRPPEEKVPLFAWQTLRALVAHLDRALRQGSAQVHDDRLAECLDEARDFINRGIAAGYSPT